jgi:Arc/MetJ-type ribon-helix-helix transcriptional regulator
MTIQLAVKLPESLADELDRLVADGSFASRSDAVRHAVEVLVRASERERIDRAFADGFARYPNTPAEMADATRLAVESIEDEPWERWW